MTTERERGSVGERATTADASSANGASSATAASERAVPEEAGTPTLPHPRTPTPAPRTGGAREAAPAPGGEGAYESRSEVRVRYVETDQMGFAHHSNYFAWFEIGRTDFIRALGTTYAQLERDGLLLAIAEAQVRYLNAARYDDLLLVRTSLERVQSRSVTFAYEVVRSMPEPRLRIATATMKLIALDEKGSPRTLPPDFRRRMDQVAVSAVP